MTIANMFARPFCTSLAAFDLMLSADNAQAQTVIYCHIDALGWDLPGAIVGAI